MSKVFVNAVNIHQGGGKSLLITLLKELNSYDKVYVYLDKRIQLHSNEFNNLNIKYITPSVYSRLLHEIHLFLQVKKGDKLLCFGNLPPLFPLLGHVVVFVQNRYIVESKSLSGFPVLTRIRIFIERLWFMLKQSNVDEFVVQTPTMKNLLLTNLKYSKKVHQITFVDQQYLTLTNQVSNADNFNISETFIYVASGEPHKNHKNLIKAWCLLANKGCFPRLILTVDSNKFSNLCKWIDSKIINYDINVLNVGYLDYENIINFYNKSTVLIYPSTFESLGLPLIEAKSRGLKIIAGELDYVRDLVDPNEVFDPNSPISISRAVERLIKFTDAKVSLKTADEFISELKLA